MSAFTQYSSPVSSIPIDAPSGPTLTPTVALGPPPPPVVKLSLARCPRVAVAQSGVGRGPGARSGGRGARRQGVEAPESARQRLVEQGRSASADLAHQFRE